jgi:hypothetical protein
VFALQYLYACPLGFLGSVGVFGADDSGAVALEDILEALAALPSSMAGARALRLGGILKLFLGKSEMKMERKKGN